MDIETALVCDCTYHRDKAWKNYSEVWKIQLFFFLLCTASCVWCWLDMRGSGVLINKEIRTISWMSIRYAEAACRVKMFLVVPQYGNKEEKDLGDDTVLMLRGYHGPQGTGERSGVSGNAGELLHARFVEDSDTSRIWWIERRYTHILLVHAFRWETEMWGTGRLAGRWIGNLLAMPKLLLMLH